LKIKATRYSLANLFMQPKGLLCFMSSIVLVLAFIASAGAYILRGPHIIELMVRQLGRPGTLLVSQRMMYYDDFFDKGVIEARETVRYVFPHTFRCDSRSENAERIWLVAHGDGLTIVDGKVAVTDEFQFDRYKDILLYRSRALLAARLSYLGVDITATSFERFEDGIVLVMGTEARDTRVNQVWVDKETFKPVRWLMPGQDMDGRHFMREIRYRDWRQVNSAWYPMHIQFFQDDILVREIRVDQMKVNPVFPEELFDISRLRFEHLAETMETDDEKVSDELNEVQETIDEFRKKYE